MSKSINKLYFLFQKQNKIKYPFIKKTINIQASNFI